MGTTQGSDEILVSQMQSGNDVLSKQAWAKWYEQDRGQLANYVRRRITDLPSRGTLSHQVEDIVEDCFIIGFQKVSSDRFKYYGTPLIAFLYAIAERRVKAAHRKTVVPSSRRPRYESLVFETEEGEYERILPTDNGFDSVDDRLDLENALATLSPENQILLEERYYLGKGCRLIGEERGIQPGTVRVKIHRAIGDLQNRLGAGKQSD